MAHESFRAGPFMQSTWAQSCLSPVRAYSSALWCSTGKEAASALHSLWVCFFSVQGRHNGFHIDNNSLSLTGLLKRSREATQVRTFRCIVSGSEDVGYCSRFIIRTTIGTAAQVLRLGARHRASAPLG